jgi:aarF domain-containing kinase
LQRVLTAEFIHGTNVDNVESLKKQNFSLSDIDKKLFQAFSEQIFHTGFVHADPHPGNGKKAQHCVGDQYLVLAESFKKVRKVIQ